MRDYYEILGVGKSADAGAIKKAYRKLALLYHPDRNDGDQEAEEKFKEATEAYEVLRDERKRDAYDRFGHAGVKGGGGPAGFGFEEAINIFMRDFGGLGGFEELFGGGRRRGARRVRKGSELRLRLSIPLVEVATGVRKELKVKLLDPCEACRGSGAAGGTGPVVCETCAGTGETRRVRQSVFGQIISASECPACRGEGQRVERPCPECRGDGRQRVERTVEVAVPPGVSSNNYLTLRGQGNAGPRGGPRGDIVVIIEVEEDPRFLRDGDDLIHDLPVSFSQAALGARVVVPTVYGDEALEVPAGVQGGDVLTLNGKGLPRLGGGTKGDQHVRVRVWTPVDLTLEQEALFRDLAGHEGEPPQRDRGGGFWKKVKEAFAV